MSTRSVVVALLVIAAALPAQACSACVTTVTGAPSWLLTVVVGLLFAGLFVWPRRARIFLPVTLVLWIVSDGLNGRFDIQKSVLVFALACGAMQMAFSLFDRREDGRRRRLLVAVVSVLVVNTLLLLPRASFRITACRSKLMNIGVALEVYAADHHGTFPRSLDALSFSYLKESVPRCWDGAPELGNDGRRWLEEMWGVHLGAYTYEVSPTATSYTVSCSGRNHPLYSRLQYTPARGLESIPR